MKGNVMAIGGANAKIRGFFELCKARGLTGQQGILLPHSNVNDLMLDEEVIAAVKSRQFHIYSIQHVDEGMKLLSGLSSSAVAKAVHQGMDSLEKAKDGKDAGTSDPSNSKEAKSS